MRFSKYHGAGNDFVMIEDLAATMGPAGGLDPALVSALCDRHLGVGADGVIRALGPAADAETAASGATVRMDYYNADGGPAEMCGNGIRCLCLLGIRRGWLRPGEQVVYTGGGPRNVVVDGAAATVSVGVATPSFERSDVPMTGDGSALRATVDAGGSTVTGTGLSMSNPHFVLFVDELRRPLDDDLVLGLGSVLERAPAFPQRTNVEFVEVISDEEITMRVWERGIGETMACGSGACAAAVASAMLGRTKRSVAVNVPGGRLGVDWREDGVAWLTGPAEEVFTGEIDEAWLAGRWPRG